MKQTQLWLVVGSLVAAALAIAFFKVSQLGFPLTPDLDTDSWTIEAKMSFSGRDESVSLKLALPDIDAAFAVTDEALIASGFGTRIETNETGQRFAVYERREQSGDAVLFYRARLIGLDARLDPTQTEAPKAVSDYRRSLRRKALRENATPMLLALDGLLNEALEKSAGEESFVTQLAQMSANLDDKRVGVIIEGGPSEIKNTADRLVFLLNASGTPARLVQGLRLGGETVQGDIESWVEYWLNDRWNAASGQTAERLDTSKLVPVSYNRAPIIEGDGYRRLRLSWSVSRNFESQIDRAMEQAEARAPWISGLSLLNLPIDLQMVFRVLLLVPLGALVIVLLKQIVGMPAFGTFMPVLIALAFRETHLLAGILLFSGIVAIGLMLRAYFAQLRLLLVPRLAAVLIVVTFLMMGIAIFSANTGMPVGLSISLFPLVIITMTIERMSLVWEEDGPKAAVKKAAGSLFGASLGYLIITNSQIEHIAFVFPELLLIVLAVVLLLGRYNGYKLTEYTRFKMMAQKS